MNCTVSQELVVVVEEYIVLVLVDDIHGAEYIQRIIDAPLHILKVYSLSLLYTQKTGVRSNLINFIVDSVIR